MIKALKTKVVKANVGKICLFIGIFALIRANTNELCAQEPPVLEDARLYEVYQRASELRDMRRYDDALTLFTYLYKRNPDDIYIKNYIRLIKKEKSDSEKKWNETIVEEAINRKKKTVGMHMRDGLNFYRRREYDEAMLEFQEILLLQPNNKKAQKYIESIRSYYKEQFEVTRLMEEDPDQSAGIQDAGGLERFVKETVKKMRDADLFVEERTGNSLEDAVDRILLASEMRLADLQGDFSGESESSMMIGDAAADRDAIATADNRFLKEYAQKNIEKRSVKRLLDDAELKMRVDAIVERVKREKSEINFDYKLGPEDELQINVRDHPEFSGRVVIGRKGEIVLPLTNDILYIGDLTKEDALIKVTETLAHYVENPQVTLEIAAYKSKKYYVVREGSTPRRIPLRRMDLTLYDVLLNENINYTDDLRRVRIMQPHMRHPTYRVVDVHSMIYKGQMENNTFIRPNDMVYIPKTFIHQTGVNLKEFLDPALTVYSQSQRAGRALSDIKGGVGFQGPTERIGENEAEKPGLRD